MLACCGREHGKATSGILRLGYVPGQVQSYVLFAGSENTTHIAQDWTTKSEVIKQASWVEV